MPVVRSSDAESGTVTQALVPLNESAFPYLPVVQVALLSVPVLPLPDESAVVVPLPASKPYAATAPVGAVIGVLMSVWSSLALGARLYGRLSSSFPGKSSPRGASPPIRSGSADVAIAPA